MKDNKNIDTLVEKISTKRYTSTRIRRIITANLLGITDSFVKECLNEDLYCKVLAVKNDSKDLLGILNKNCNNNLLTKITEASFNILDENINESIKLDILANNLVGNISSDYTNNIII